MPKHQFLAPGQKLNKDNLIEVLSALKLRATRQIEDKPTEVEKYFDEVDKLVEYEKLEYIINFYSNRMSILNSHNFSITSGFDEEQIRTNALTHFRFILQKYAPNNEQKTELLNLINNEEENRELSISDIADRVKNIIPEEHEKEVKSKAISFIPQSIILNHFDEFINLMRNELSNNTLESLGNTINEMKSKYEYTYKDDITKPLYQEETAELLSILNNTRKVDGKELTDEEVYEYERALMKANELFGEPKIDLDSMLLQKNELDKAINHDQKRSSDDIIRNMGFNPNITREGFSHNDGPYIELLENKEEDLNNLRNGIELEFSQETKEGLKLILNKLHEYGYDKNGITGEEETKVYGLRALFDAGMRYKRAISNPDPNERIKAISYAKEVYEADKKIQELLDLIEKYMPVSLDNLAFPGNVDSLRTELMPPSYRLDFIRTSHLADLYSLANLIEEKKWDIDDFIDHPMRYLKEYYNDDYLEKVSPTKMNEGLTGDDLIFSIGRLSINKNLDNMPMGGGRIVEGLSNVEKNPELRARNAAVYNAFNKVIYEPYNIANGYREYVALNEHLDDILINPNVTFNELKIKTYNAKTLKYEEPENERFDEINYIKNRTESLKDLKERINLSILKYMKNEIELATQNRKSGVMYLTSNKFMNVVQKAIAKELTIRRDEKDLQDYQELELLINNKRSYIHNLIEEIDENGKYHDFMIVKNTNSNPPRIDNLDFNPADLDTANNYKNTLTNFDTYITDSKQSYNRDLTQFINSQKIINNELKNRYQKYIYALNKYNNEVRKIYGDNYKGDIDNFRSDKLLDAFNKKNDLYKEFINYKGHSLDDIETNVKNGRIPLSYYEDRKLQLDNNDFKDIPPLFRTDKPFNIDEYIKLKHPNDYQNLSDEEKNIIFESYKKNIKRIENDFFARKYLISKHLTDEKAETFEIQKFEKNEIENAPLNEKKLEAQLIGVSSQSIIDSHIGEEDYKFAEITYLREKNQQIADFKDNIDKKLLDLVKRYNDASLNNELAQLPKLDKVIDVFQKSTLKYLLTVGEYDKNNPLYKDLKNLLSDGNGYINNLIINENKKIDERNAKIAEDRMKEIENNPEDGLNELNFENLELEDKISFNIKDFGVEDHKINNYNNVIKEFEKYYKEKIRTNYFKLPDDVKNRETYLYENIQIEYKRLKDHQSIYSDLQRARNENKNLLIQDEIITLEEINNILQEADFETIIRNDQIMLDKLITREKDKLSNYYRSGIISEEYFKESFRRIENKDFRFPPFFMLDEMPSLDEYVKEKYPNEYNNLSKDEKNIIYNSYKAECEENRRQFILNKFLVEKGLSEFVKPTCPKYEEYIELRFNEINRNNQEYENIQNQRNENLNRINDIIKEREEIEIREKEVDEALEKSIIDEKLPDFGDIEEIKILDDEFDVEENQKLKNDVDEMEEIQKNREYIADIISGKSYEMIDPFAKWTESLRNILRERMGEAYDTENIDEVLAYDPKKDSFVYWFDTKLNKLETLLGNNMNNVFDEAFNNLDDKWKKNFNIEISKLPEYEKYFPNFFKNEKDKDIIPVNEDDNNIIPKNEDNDHILPEDSFMKRVFNDLKEEVIEEDEIDDYIDDLFKDDKELGK